MDDTFKKENIDYGDKPKDLNEIGTSGTVLPPHMASLDVKPDAAPDVPVTPLKVEQGGIPRKRLGSADVRKVRDLKTEDVEVPEWGGFITIKALTAKERDDFESSMLEKKGKTREFKNTNIRAKLVVKCACDELGNRVWSDEDASWLGDKNAHAVNLLYEAAARLSGITEADADELEGNSPGAVGDA
ncbi:MAG: hypothetical protein ABI119_06045 [Gemmatimonadaceae bacterium]